MSDLQQALNAWVADWSTISVAQLQFWHRDTGRLALIGLLLVRGSASKTPPDHRLR